MAVVDRKVRIVCLHGYLQSATAFRMRLGSMRKALKSRAEFLFVDAPYLAEAAEDESGGSSSGGRSWWQWQDLEPGTRPSRAAKYSGWEASQRAIQEAITAHAPVDGLMGFSQGATAAALYLAGRGGGLDPGVQWSVLIGGFLPRDEGHALTIRSAREAGLALPSLHVSGAEDQLVPVERSQQLWECFAADHRRVFLHPGAHMVPTCTGDFKQALVEFVDDQRTRQAPAATGP